MEEEDMTEDEKVLWAAHAYAAEIILLGHLLQLWNLSYKKFGIISSKVSFHKTIRDLVDRQKRNSNTAP
jgi:hypothetical protein